MRPDVSNYLRDVLREAHELNPADSYLENMLKEAEEVLEEVQKYALK